MQVNGAAAHLTRPGHKIIVASFGAYDESDLETYSPVVVHVDADNAIVRVDSHPEVLLGGPVPTGSEDVPGSFSPSFGGGIPS
jgi:aspartate 1-decarboxylase